MDKSDTFRRCCLMIFLFLTMPIVGASTVEFFRVEGEAGKSYIISTSVTAKSKIISDVECTYVDRPYSVYGAGGGTAVLSCYGHIYKMGFSVETVYGEEMHVMSRRMYSNDWGTMGTETLLIPTGDCIDNPCNITVNLKISGTVEIIDSSFVGFEVSEFNDSGFNNSFFWGIDSEEN